MIEKSKTEYFTEVECKLASDGLLDSFLIRPLNSKRRIIAFHNIVPCDKSCDPVDIIGVTEFWTNKRSR